MSINRCNSNSGNTSGTIQLKINTFTVPRKHLLLLEWGPTTPCSFRTAGFYITNVYRGDGSLKAHANIFERAWTKHREEPRRLQRDPDYPYCHHGPQWIWWGSIFSSLTGMGEKRILQPSPFRWGPRLPSLKDYGRPKPQLDLGLKLKSTLPKYSHSTSLTKQKLSKQSEVREGSSQDTRKRRVKGSLQQFSLGKWGGIQHLPSVPHSRMKKEEI